MKARTQTDPLFDPHPDFTTFSDERLNLFQGLLQLEIDDLDDGLEKTYREQRMRVLQTERARRQGGAGATPSLILQEEALCGLAGDIVRTILPFTEADPVALLAHLLCSFGNIIGHSAHWRMEKTLHFLNLFIVLVGDTSRGRKGTSRSTLDYMFTQIDESWRAARIMSGLSSGQGLIWNVRDPISERKPVKEKGRPVKYEEVIVDNGEPDKRLMIVEEEFAHVLRATPLEGSVLSVVMRQAWDSGNLRTLTSGRKFNPVKASDAHVSIVGHITKPELLRHLDSTEQANGFANRFLWLIVERSKKIPNPKGTPDSLLGPLIERLRDAVNFSIKADKMERDDDAETVWAAIYDKLTEDARGLVNAITARAAPQVMRIACLYSLLDLSTTVRPEHLKAALAVWDYADASARVIFGDSLGEPTADKILNAIKRSDAGLSATDIYSP